MPKKYRNPYHYNPLSRFNTPQGKNIGAIMGYWNATFHEGIKEYHLTKALKYTLGSHAKLPAEEIKRAIERYRDAVESGTERRVTFFDFFNPEKRCNVWQFLDDAVALKEKSLSAPPGETIIREVEALVNQLMMSQSGPVVEKQLNLWRGEYGNYAVDEAIKRIKGA